MRGRTVVRCWDFSVADCLGIHISGVVLMSFLPWRCCYLWPTVCRCTLRDLSIPVTPSECLIYGERLHVVPLWSPVLSIVASTVLNISNRWGLYHIQSSGMT